MRTLLSIGGGLLFLGAIALTAIGDGLFSSVANGPALGHEPGDAVAWALVVLVLIPLGSVVFFAWKLYRRSRRPMPAYAEFLEAGKTEAIDASGNIGYR